ncbi:hypothetical protein [Methanohalobium sp.]|uniref:hypothetical protein n=1 Tax=Methanohalobium sp. TaxID=2837493 RepID=UPI0025E76C46|nr:hypothetical protein [Methanohalobium sp.]
MNYMAEAGLENDNINIDMHRNDVTIDEGTNVPVKTTLTFIGIGNPEPEKEI